MTLIGRAVLTILPMSLVVACSGNKPAASKTESAAKAPVAAVAGQVGVPECDEFLTKYEACIQGKVPESVRGTLSQSMAQARDAWKQAAATPEGKQGLAMACKQMLDTTKQSMTAYGCQW
jgi:hypothetical protein